ncbi:hypothetical protein FHS95_003555 [Sphingomonas naasensis]|uniref:DUF1801 domain-containing protein n=1 Tax=Sphingomonas naasensis TaxID=1344951 RepID=A0A4S1WH60_9SPHN|nr:DUF1801 domain-containing protein [Sphingomonas naasensis]NIJ21844.1 hypothetical protein [Sphingomonas naasensis]TGX42458.1 DUF1801 domain-containing protein [Sphingomonas naasensis]
MAETRTRPTEMRVTDFIEAAPDAVRREDAKTLVELMSRISGEEPRMWGPSIIGFGSYHYRYESGHEGDACRLGFSPRKTELVLYVLNGSSAQEALLARLGKHKTGKACLYIKKLADVDMGVLEELVRDALAAMDARYPR